VILQVFYRDSLGIEITSFYVSHVKLRKKGKRLKILNSGIKFAKYTADEGERHEQILQFLKEIKKEAKYDIEDILVVNFPMDELLFWRMTLPKMNEEQMKNAAKIQINKELNVPIEDIILDFVDIGVSGVMKDLGIFITKVQTVNRIVSMLRSAGFDEPDVVDVDFLKYLHLCDKNRFSTLDFVAIESFEGTTIAIIQEGKIAWMEVSPISLMELAYMLSDNYGVSVENALKILAEGSEIGSFGKDVSEILDAHYRNTGLEIEKLIRSFASSRKMDIGKATLYLFSVNLRMSNEFAKYIENTGILGGIPVRVLPLRNDVPVFSAPIGALGLAYRGVMEVGEGIFISKEKAKT